MAEQKNEGPGRRDLAADRTLLANDRTLAAWWRTAMTALAAAVAFAELLGEVQPQWVVRGGAAALVLLAFASLATAARRYLSTAREIEAQEVERLPRAGLWAGSALLVLAGLAALFAVWS